MIIIPEVLPHKQLAVAIRSLNSNSTSITQNNALTIYVNGKRNKIHCWQYFNKRDYYKRKISYRINFSPQFTSAICLSCNTCEKLSPCLFGFIHYQYDSYLEYWRSLHRKLDLLQRRFLNYAVPLLPIDQIIH